MTAGEMTRTRPDGSVVTYAEDGHVIRQRTPDGSVFDDFDSAGNPGHALLPSRDGQPQTSVDITYEGKQSTWHYPDSTVTRDADGAVIRQETSDGTVYDRFTEDGNPSHAILPDHAGTVDITYQHGTSTWAYSDGSTIVRESDGDVLRQQTADGTVFDRFSPDHRPTHATLPDHAGTAEISYRGDNSTWSYSDGTRVDRGADGHVTHMHSGDADFDRFTADDKPAHGVVAGRDGEPAQEVTISYDDGGGSTWSYKDGTTVDRGADGHVTHMHSGDADFDRFTADDKPAHGVVAGRDGEPAQ
ncbi:hypothetical protein, partial [Actinoplanes sp. NBRC 103695]|uniref:hypothetical protein n=1 Tax=Actinoplanes sp. NBRC 103695 TaxID=3032202 RepID=UPI0024A4E147